LADNGAMDYTFRKGITAVSNSSEGHRHRLRRKFLKSGLAGFHDYEVLELLLTLGTPRRDCKPLAKRLLEKFGSLRAVLDASPGELRKVEGIGEINQVGILLPRAVAGLYREIQARQCPVTGSPASAAEYLRAEIGSHDREVFKILLLDNSNRVRDIITLFEGTIDQTVVHPREVVAAALKAGASRMVLAHNHPGGTLAPSAQDRALTRRLKEACRLVGVEVLDHIIVSDRKGYYSMKENNEI